MRALILSRLMIEYSRILIDGHGPRRRNAGTLADNLVLSAVCLGQMEGRPMTAHKIAQFCGMTRPTVVRKLRELEASGRVEMHNGLARIPASIMESEALAVKMAALSKVVHKAARDLSKLDIKPIAPRRKK